MNDHGDELAESNHMLNSTRNYSNAFAFITAALCTFVGAYVGWRLADMIMGVIGAVFGLFSGLYFAVDVISEQENEVISSILTMMKYLGGVLLLLLGYILVIELSLKVLGSDQPLGLYICIPPVVLLLLVLFFVFVNYLFTALRKRLF